MSLLNQYSSSEHEYRRMMDELARQQMMQAQQYMAPASLSACIKPTEPSPVLLLLPRKAA